MLAIAVDTAHSANVQIWAVDGTLLGAVRDGRFAGRPSDIDLAIRHQHLDLFLTSLQQELTSGTRWRQVLTSARLSMVALKSSSQQPPKRYLKWRLFGGWVSIVELVPIWTDESGRTFLASAAQGNVHEPRVLAGGELDGTRSACIFRIGVRIPENAEELLALMYGADWRIPRSLKQM